MVDGSRQSYNNQKAPRGFFRMSELPEKPTLKDFQTYVDAMVKARGFDQEGVPEAFMLFLEECGELAKAARKAQHIKTGAHSDSFKLAEELADVFWYVVVLANKFNIDLEQAFRAKEEVNKQRVWK